MKRCEARKKCPNEFVSFTPGGELLPEIINKYAKLNWKEFIEMAKEYKCSNIIYTALLITKMTLGCNLPECERQEKVINTLK